MNTGSAKEALIELYECYVEREKELVQHSSVRIADSDEEADLECHIFDSFYDAGRNERIRVCVTLREQNSATYGINLKGILRQTGM